MMIMKIDDILLLRTLIIFIPYGIVGGFFYYKIKDPFFLKARSHIQLTLMMIGLFISFCWVVLWNLSFNDFAFLSYEVTRTDSGSMILILLGILGAVLGWLFTTRGQALNSRKSHSIQTLMSSRLSSVYFEQIKLATKVFNDLKATNGTSYNITMDEFNKRSDDEKAAVAYLLNYYEYIAVGIRFGDLDENLIKNTLASNVKTNFDFFKDFIDFKQKGSKTCLEHLTALYKRWNC